MSTTVLMPPPPLPVIDDTLCAQCRRSALGSIIRWSNRQRYCYACAAALEDAGRPMFKSACEDRVYEAGCKMLPSPWLTPEYPIVAEGVTWSWDFALYQPVLKLVCDIDGRHGHSSYEAIHRDRKKDMAARRAGFAPYRFSGSEAWHNPEAVVTEMLQIVDEEVGRQLPFLRNPSAYFFAAA